MIYDCYINYYLRFDLIDFEFGCVAVGKEMRSYLLLKS